MTITEVKTTLSGERKEFDCELLKRDRHEAVVIYRMPRERQLEDVVLPKGCVSLGYFWEHKPFNAYHWIDDKGQTLALYFNVSDSTRLTESQIAWRDLCVDVLLTPDGRCRVLDEDELPDDLDHALQAHIDSARDALCVDASHLLSAFGARTRRLLDGA